MTDVENAVDTEAEQAESPAAQMASAAARITMSEGAPYDDTSPSCVDETMEYSDVQFSRVSVCRPVKPGPVP